MKRFDEWRQRRTREQIEQVNKHLDHLAALLERLGPDDERRTAIEGDRVRAWWKRNDLYAKLASTKES